MRPGLFLSLVCLLSGGCAAIPEISHEPQVHNPFPQLHRVAILPFFNLSADPTIHQDDVALAYYTELQQIPGFEVMPPGVVKKWLVANRVEIDGSTDFQELARRLGVDAVIRGAVTEFSPYYPPRMGLAVDWFAANPSFHPIPPGYGLPWGTTDEEYIPDSLVFEAEFALAREQLATQTPEVPPDIDPDPLASASPVRPAQRVTAERLPPTSPDVAGAGPELPSGSVPGLPPDWPDPRGFVPPPPSPARPPYRPQFEPVITHTRLYTGDDARVTDRLADYVNVRDDAREWGWQGYLSRSHDFIRFCCYLHVTETLAARGGAGKPRVVWRWPIGRYDVGTGRR
jgi:hypothetical protein